jgi:hypothetical protein
MSIVEEIITALSRIRAAINPKKSPDKAEDAASRAGGQ